MPVARSVLDVVPSPLLSQEGARVLQFSEESVVVGRKKDQSDSKGVVRFQPPPIVEDPAKLRSEKTLQ